MDSTTLPLLIARGRMAAGLGAFALPGLSTRFMTGKKAHGAETLYTRMWGARDFAIGLGAVVAIDQGKPVRGWIEAGATADVGDFLSSLLARKVLTDNAYKAFLVIAGGAAVTGWALAQTLESPPAAHPGQPEAVVTLHPQPS